MTRSFVSKINAVSVLFFYVVSSVTVHSFHTHIAIAMGKIPCHRVCFKKEIFINKRDILDLIQLFTFS